MSMLQTEPIYDALIGHTWFHAKMAKCGSPVIEKPFGDNRKTSQPEVNEKSA
jgi:hypothetical protein